MFQSYLYRLLVRYECLFLAELPAGKPINALIGFANKGLRDFTFETVDASFRYPQDFSYSIQNFTGYRYHRMIEQNSEASFEYAFHPHESYGGRPFGLVVTAIYKDDVSIHELTCRRYVLI